MAFLVANMPDSDLLSLKADFLLENVDLAYKARQQARLGQEDPRRDVPQRCPPLCQRGRETAIPGGKEMYDAVPAHRQGLQDAGRGGPEAERDGVQASSRSDTPPAARRPNQSPKESIEQGLASCTGLSIVLIDACRSVGVPTRLVGTPMWANKAGNHTWVEIWDGDWHFTGACEPDPQGPRPRLVRRRRRPWPTRIRP